MESRGGGAQAHGAGADGPAPAREATVAALRALVEVDTAPGGNRPRGMAVASYLEAVTRDPGWLLEAPFPVPAPLHLVARSDPSWKACLEEAETLLDAGTRIGHEFGPWRLGLLDLLVRCGLVADREARNLPPFLAEKVTRVAQLVAEDLVADEAGEVCRHTVGLVPPTVRWLVRPALRALRGRPEPPPEVAAWLDRAADGLAGAPRRAPDGGRRAAPATAAGQPPLPPGGGDGAHGPGGGPGDAAADLVEILRRHAPGPYTRAVAEKVRAGTAQPGPRALAGLHLLVPAGLPDLDPESDVSAAVLGGASAAWPLLERGSPAWHAAAELLVAAVVRQAVLAAGPSPGSASPPAVVRGLPDGPVQAAVAAAVREGLDAARPLGGRTGWPEAFADTVGDALLFPVGRGAPLVWALLLLDVPDAPPAAPGSVGALLGGALLGGGAPDGAPGGAGHGAERVEALVRRGVRRAAGGAWDPSWVAARVGDFWRRVPGWLAGAASP